MMTDDDFADAVEADNSPVAKLLAAKDDEIERLRAALAERGEPVAWLDPVTRCVITDDTKRRWEAGSYGDCVHGSTYTVPLYAKEVPR